MLTAGDYTFCTVMGLAAVMAAASFAAIMRYLLSHNLVDPTQGTPDIRSYYRAYMAHTRKHAGRIGGALWLHGIAAGAFIFIGVGYTLYRLVLPRFF